MAEQQAPNWLNYLGQVSQMREASGTTPPYAPGTKTQRHHEMKSRERISQAQIASSDRQHAARMAMEREKLALDRFDIENKWKYNWLQFEALQNLEQEAGFSGGYFGSGSGKQTPAQATTDFSVRDIWGGTTAQERRDPDLRGNLFGY